MTPRPYRRRDAKLAQPRQLLQLWTKGLAQIGSSLLPKCKRGRSPASCESRAPGLPSKNNDLCGSTALAMTSNCGETLRSALSAIGVCGENIAIAVAVPQRPLIQGDAPQSD